MSKIICDICGTSYADTATQCPICGCVRPAQAKTVPEADKNGAGGYTYVRGGRFSKTNVRRRNAGESVPQKSVKKSPNKDNEPNTKVVAIIIVIALLLVGLVVLLVSGVFSKLFSNISSEPTPTPTQNQEPMDIPCTEITLTKDTFILEEIGDSALIRYSKYPTNTTDDEVTFISGNELVATVDSNGRIVAVGNGTITITVKCGDATQTCQVIVGDGIFVAPVELELDFDEVTFSTKGEEKLVYSGKIPADQITWETDNPYIATVKNGVVTAEGSGRTVIYATYRDQKVSCEITCDLTYIDNGEGGITEDGNGGSGSSSGGITEDGSDGPLGSGGGGITEDGSESVGIYRIHTIYGETYFNDYLNCYDVTIHTGDSLSFYLKDANGNKMQVQWSLSDEGVCSLDGNTVEGLASGNVYISAQYKGNTYKCYIRVN